MCAGAIRLHVPADRMRGVLRRSGSAMRRFLDGEEAPQEFDVHVWEAAVAAPHQQVPARGKGCSDMPASMVLSRSGSGSGSGPILQGRFADYDQLAPA